MRHDAFRFITMQCWLLAFSTIESLDDKPTRCSSYNKRSVGDFRRHQNDRCPVDVRQKNAFSTEFSPPIDDNESVVDNAVSSQSSNEQLLTSFRKNPTKGQHLILVQRQSMYALQLEANVAHRLRQMQQLHSTDKNDVMDRTPWERVKIYILPGEQVSTAAAEADDYAASGTNQSAVDGSRAKRPTSAFLSVDDETVPLMLKSHPGFAIVPLSALPYDAGFMQLGQENCIDLGVGRIDQQDDAMIRIRLLTAESVPRNGRRRSVHDSHNSNTRYYSKRFELQTDHGSVLMIGSDIAEGASITLSTLTGQHGTDPGAPIVADNVDNEDLTIAQAALFTDCDRRCQFVVNMDGSLSPTSARHLVVGIAPYPAVTLLPRDSPHRFIFRDPRNFWSAPAPINGTPMLLASHPGLAVVALRPNKQPAFGVLEMQQLGVGPAKHAIRLFSIDHTRHHQFLLFNQQGLALVPFNWQLDAGAAVRLMRYNTSDETVSKKWILTFLQLAMRASGNATWIINDEGSISSLNAPHLVLGCDYIAASAVAIDSLVSDRQRHEAYVVAQSHWYQAQRRGPPSIWTPDVIRYIHLGYYILFVEGFVGPLLFIVALVLLLFIKIVPWPIWVTLLAWLFFGTSALLFCAGFWVGAVVAKLLLQWQKRQRANAPAILPPAAPALAAGRHRR